jgi:hypothetical protein
MKKAGCILVTALLFASCLKSSAPLTPNVEEDPSIVFPSFFAQPSVAAGAEGVVFALDGETLRALLVATRDLLPPQDSVVSCGSRLESQQYRIVRQGDVIFIRIDENPMACGRTHPAMDSGASYAVHRDGRLLRRSIDGQLVAHMPAVAVPVSSLIGPRVRQVQ